MSLQFLVIRLRSLHNLIFFSLLLSISCGKNHSDEIQLIWSNEKATGILIPKDLIHGIYDSLERRLIVRVAGYESIAMLGNYKSSNGDITFEPIVPFTRGLHYEVLLDNQSIGEITIPSIDSTNAPILFAIYPTEDTVPENLLKLYLQFSKPMREGRSIQHLTLLKNNRDTVAGAFLDLQPELWNDDRTMLTVWLDPGRIKRDLQPNKLYGPPLQKGEQYTLVISDQWKDTQNAALTKSYYKKFVVTSRDSLSPDPMTWTIHNPKTGTMNILNIDFKSALDYSLLNSTIHIVNGQGEIVLGNWNISDEERKASFRPEAIWNTGNYQLQVETRLEDLAGNNLNRAFDTNVQTRVKPSPSAKIISLTFSCTN